MNYKEEPKYKIHKDLKDYFKSNSNVEQYFSNNNNVTLMSVQNNNNQVNQNPSQYHQGKPVNQIILRRCASENYSEEADLKVSSNQNKSDVQKLNNTKINQQNTIVRNKNSLLKKGNKSFEEFFYEVCLVAAFIFFIVSLTYTINKELKI